MKTAILFVWMDPMACLGDELPYEEHEAGCAATSLPLPASLALIGAG